MRRKKIVRGLTHLSPAWHYLVGAIAVVCLVAAVLLIAANKSHATDRTHTTDHEKPAPLPSPTTTSAPASQTSSDSHTARSFVITAIVITAAACAVSWDECKALFAGGQPQPGKPDTNPESLVPASANPQLYELKTEGSFRVK